ncbi:MAG: hydrogenase 2 operon protein HybA [Thermodesulfovibrionales bacterium]
MDMNRRNFLKVAAGGSLLLATGTAADAREARKLSADAVGILYDATVCIGCKVCQTACKEHNKMPAEHSSKDMLWDDPVDLSAKTLNIIKLYANGSGVTKDSEIDGYSFIKRHCMHCVDPACVSACPVTALKKDAKNGVVSYNKDACIGCRYCQIACPYNIPKFEFDKALPQIRKCQLCDHRYKEDKFSACCEFCPTGASIFGNVNDLLAEAKKRLALRPGDYYKYPVAHVRSRETSYRPVAKYQGRIYGEKEGGGAQYLLLAGVPFTKLGMPDLDETSDAAFSENIQHTIYKGMIGPGVLLAGLLFAAYKSTNQKDE